MRIQGVHTPSELKNYIINGGLDFWQEKGATTTTINTASTVASYASDMFLTIAFGPTNKNFSYGRDTDVPTPAQSGFQAQYSFLRTTITAQPTFASTDFIDVLQYRMEGLDYAKIHGKMVNIGFWMKASVVGAYSVALSNNSETRSYVTTVTQNVANTWEYKTVNVQLEVPTVNYSFTNSNALFLRIGSLAGTTNSTSTLNQWQNGAFYSSTTSVNHAATAGSTIRITQISITEGTQGFGALGFQRAGKNIQQELAMCQRYYEKSYGIDATPGTTGNFSGAEWNFTPVTISNSGFKNVAYRIIKRTASATLTPYSILSGAANTMTNVSTSLSYTASGTSNTDSGAIVNFGPGATVSAGNAVSFHWVADARL